MSVCLFSCQQDDDVMAPTGVEFTLSAAQNDDGARIKQDGVQPVIDVDSCDMDFASYAEVVIGGVLYTVPVKQWGDSYKTNLIELDLLLEHLI